MSAFQNMDLGAAAPGPRGNGGGAAPKIDFDPVKVQALQGQYLKESAALWTQGMQSMPLSGDKRFADAAWTGNPVAAHVPRLRTMFISRCRKISWLRSR